MSPTSRQVEVLRAIASLSDASGYPPSIRQLVEALGVTSTHTVACHLLPSLVTRDARVARSLRLTSEGRRWVK